MTILDGSSSFQLPTVAPDPLGTGSVTYAVTTADLPSFDATKFDIPSVKRTLVRASGAQTTFTK